ncbi:MAG: MBL fold metallo-hydrolase [Clostridium sp.]|nr:MBL fold metallo-hydrolase [Clostridium sp.]
MLFKAIIVILLVAAVILFMQYVFPMCTMHPLASGTIAGTDIIAIHNRINNLFFIPAGEDWIVIDAGSDAGKVKQEMERLSIDGQRVKGVFLTHTDYDHVASVVLFPNAVIYMSEQEKQMIDGSTYRQFFKKNKLPQMQVSSQVPSSSRQMDIQACPPGSLPGGNKIVYLSEHKTIEVITDYRSLGAEADKPQGQQRGPLCRHRVRMIPASGHTKGSAMYVVDEKYLFTGDAFKTAGGRILLHPYTMDKKQAKKTIQRVEAELGKYDKVFTAHYGLVGNDTDAGTSDGFETGLPGNRNMPD